VPGGGSRRDCAGASLCRPRQHTAKYVALLAQSGRHTPGLKNEHDCVNEFPHWMVPVAIDSAQLPGYDGTALCRGSKPIRIVFSLSLVVPLTGALFLCTMI